MVKERRVRVGWQGLGSGLGKEGEGVKVSVRWLVFGEWGLAEDG